MIQPALFAIITAQYKQGLILHAKHTQENLQSLYVQFAHLSHFIGRVPRHALHVSLFPYESLDEQVRYEPGKHVPDQVLEYLGFHVQPTATHDHPAIIFVFHFSKNKLQTVTVNTFLYELF